MPLLTRLTKLQIDQIVHDHYNLGSVKAVYKIKNGWTNTLFKITTTHGDFFLKVYEETDRMQVIAEHEVVNFLVKLKFPTANIIKTKNKEGLVDFEDKFISVFTALKGKPLTANPFKTVVGYRVISILNVLHKIPTQDFIYLRKKNLAETIEDNLSWYLNDHRMNHFRDDLLNLYEQFSDVSFFNLTKGVIHNDLGTDNFLVVGNNVTGLIDFDQVAYGNIVDDLTKFFAKSVNLNNYDVQDFVSDIIRFLTEYSKKSKLSKEDINAVVPLLVFHKVLTLIKVKQNIRQESIRAHIYNFEEYASLIEKELEILFKHFIYMQAEFNHHLN